MAVNTRTLSKRKREQESGKESLWIWGLETDLVICVRMPMVWFYNAERTMRTPLLGSTTDKYALYYADQVNRYTILGQLGLESANVY